MRLSSRRFPDLIITTTVLCALATALGGAAAGEVQPIDIRPAVSMAGAERTYWIGTGATDEEAMSLRESLVAAGARNVNLFVPDMVIVCDVPPAAATEVARVAATTAFRAHSARNLRATTVADASWGWIVDSYALADRIARGEGGAALSTAAADPDGFRDVVLTIPPDRVEAIQREVEASRALDVNATRPAIARKINQNSEFLGGYILANFVFPESNGSRDFNIETWSDEDLRQAKIGSTAAFTYWQGKFGSMDIGYVINHYERVDTHYEPISHDMASDALWVVDCMRSMGWGIHSDDAMPVVHEFNESERARWRTQWVVTSFIASSRNTPGNRFNNGTAPYTAYAYLGGPYMIEPFPAGGDPTQVGETRVYSQIVNHEIGHLFYTLDEYPGAPGVCSSRSGYLDIENHNVTMTDPEGNQGRCIAPVLCIMHTAARFDQGRPWCDWSQGHLGVLDGNDNAVPDIFEAEPVIEFVPEGPETVTTNSYTMRVKAKATAVPNRNPNQGNDRVSYALPFSEGKLIFGPLLIGLDALDGSWNELEEEAEFTLSIPQAGQSVVLVFQTRNNAGFRSQRATKTVYFAGVHFDRVIALPKWNRIVVAWETRGETFGATYDVYRLEAGQAMPGTLIAQNVQSHASGLSGPAYQVNDFDVTKGSGYRYYVEAVFVLPFEGSTQEYHSQSPIVGQTAMMQIVDVVSNMAPNPTKGTVTFSVAVPPSFEQTARGPARIPTDVDVRVFDVRGKLIRTLADSSELNAVVTMKWDGTTQDGVAVPSGVYFLRVLSGDTEAVRKIVLLR